MKKWTRFLAAFLSLLMLLSLAACGASADGVVKNLLGGKSADAIRQKDYKTTAEFYHAVEMRRMQELLGLLTGTTNLETVTSDTVFFQNELKVQLNQNVLDPSLLQLLTSEIGMDVSWAKSAAVTFTSGKQNNLSVLNAALLLNGKNIISANTVMDNASSTVYVAIPEVNEQYFSVNLSDVMRRNLGVRLNASQLGQLVTGSWIDSAKLNMRLFESKDPKTVRATALGVGHARFLLSGRVALCTVTEALCQKYGLTDENFGELPSALREIRGVELSVLLRQDPENLRKYRLSTRSKEWFDCAEFCRRFEGGGHLRSAGGGVYADSPAEAEAQIKREIRKLWKN